jgi:rhodanese-related sulfurtransferase
MRDGIKGWKQAGYDTVGSPRLLEELIVVNKNDFAALVISEQKARKLKNCCFADFRDAAAYKRSHVEGADHVIYSEMFSKPMMEKLNKSDTIVVIHDVQAVAGVIAATLKLMDYPNVYILQ